VVAVSFLIFDTLNWSPRALFPALQKPLGGRVWCHSRQQIQRMAHKFHLTIVAYEQIFILPSQLYRYVPEYVLPIVTFCENKLPASWRTKTVWMMRKD
jgi:hypothetical protein